MRFSVKYLTHGFIFLVLGLWQALCWVQALPQHIVPSPLQVCRGIGELSTVGLPPGYLLGGHILASLQRVTLGFVAAVLVGLPLGILMGWSKWLRSALTPIAEVIRPIPPLAWIPIAILWFGIGFKSAVFLIFLGALFPILLNAISGVVLLNPVLVEACLTLNVSQWELVKNVLVPGALPSVFTGMRVGLGIGWMTLVAAEFTGVKSGYGLGYMIMTARDIQRPDLILAGMAIIGLVGYGMDAGLSGLRARLLRWL